MKLEFESVSFSQLGATPLYGDYINGNPELRSFFGKSDPFNPESFSRFVSGRFGSVKRNQLADFLVSYNKQFAACRNTIEAAESLRSKDVFTVVTGQQLCFLGGPGYSFYKTLTVIALSRSLKAATKLSIVPVFWMADEDHDYDEIDHVWLPDFRKDGIIQKFSLPKNRLKGHAAAFLKLDHADEILSEINQAAEPGSAYASDLHRLHKSWQTGRPWVQAFGELMLRVFGKYGLILAGSNHADVKKLCRPVFETVLVKQPELTKIVSDTSAKLAGKWHAQVTVTDSLLFWHHPEKGRLKIPYLESGWMFPDEASPRTFTRESVRQAGDDFFAKLSPNALLRPVIQQYLLPNLAYTGGAAEIAYHSQLKAFFEAFELDLPIILPRFSATVIEPEIRKSMAHMPFSFTDYKKREDDLAHELVQVQLRESGNKLPDEVLKEWKNRNKHLFESYFRSFVNTGSSLETSLKSTLSRMEKNAEQFASKVIREKKKQDRLAIKRISNVRSALFPGGLLQERVTGWAFFYALYGDSFLEALVEELSTDTLEKIRHHHIIYV